MHLLKALKMVVANYVYHGTPKKLNSPVTTKPISNFNDLGGWFTSSEENAKYYGENVYKFDLPTGSFWEPGTEEFKKVFFDLRVAEKVLGPELAKILQQFANDEKAEPYKRFLKKHNALGLQDLFRKLVFNNPTYLKEWLADKKKRGFKGVFWPLSNIDSLPETHDVYLVFNPEQVKLVN